MSRHPPAYASEGGSSDYYPGAFGTFAVAVAPDPGFLFVNQTLPCHSKANKAVLQGRVNMSLKADVLFNFFGGFYTVDDRVLGGRLQLGAAVPVGYVKVDGSVSTMLGTREKTDRDINLGDSLLQGALYWDAGDFHVKLAQSIFAPTGAYKNSDHLTANVGRNYWAFDTSCAATWLSSKTGTELTVMPGIMFNTENHSTDYRTGNEFHLDSMLNQFLAKNFALGVQGYYYKQVTGDSGSGALLGDFKGESYGFGPALLWMPGFGDGTISLVGKWLFDSHHENRLKGDYGQVVISKKF